MPTGIGNGLAPQTFGQPLSNNSECPAAYCYEFDGLTELGYVGGFIDIGVSDFSVSIWFKTPDVTGGGGDQSLVGTKTFVGGSQTWEIYLTTVGKVAFKSTAPGWNDTFASFTPTNDTWHHVVYSVDRSGNASWYGDVSTTEVTDISTNTTNLYSVGAYGALAGGFSASEKYEGKIADIAMWDIALSASQVSEYYLNTKAPNKLCANSALDTWPNLTGWWRCSNPTGTFATPMPTYGSLSTFNFIMFSMDQANVITDYPA
jgi:hypothetical protein